VLRHLEPLATALTHALKAVSLMIDSAYLELRVITNRSRFVLETHARGKPTTWFAGKTQIGFHRFEC
jgi:hypothetical protein